jgi:hypothetical protein
MDEQKKISNLIEIIMRDGVLALDPDTGCRDLLVSLMNIQIQALKNIGAVDNFDVAAKMFTEMCTNAKEDFINYKQEQVYDKLD